MRVAGVDGFNGGWVVWEKSDTRHCVFSVQKFADIRFDDFDCVAVDMPIGILDVAVRRGREAEKLARQVLPKGRKSSVFSAPSRAIFPFVGGDFDDAKVASKARSGGISLSIQAFNIAPKIVEVDAVLRKNKKAQTIVREVHPEYAFAILNGGIGVVESKADEPGRNLRLDLLAAANFVDRIFLAHISSSGRPKGTEKDDVVDAAACCWVAEGIAQRDFHSLPANPPRDSKGLPMAIWGRGKNPPTLALPRKGGGK